MKKDEFQEIYEDVEDLVTSSGLSLRISKQKLVSGILTISKEDTIKINISTPVYVKNQTKKNLSRINENMIHRSFNNIYKQFKKGMRK